MRTLSQMKMFGIRQGVEFYPEQDNFGTQRLILFNKSSNLINLMQGWIPSGIGFFLTAKDCFTLDLQKNISFVLV
jgi:hypothetical protein